MKRHFSPRLKFFSIIGILVFMLCIPAVPSFAQDINPQAIISGSIQQGTWYEQWDQSGTMYCSNNAQRNITATSEAFSLSAPASEDTITVTYLTSRISLALARTSTGTYVHTNTSGWWVHLIEVTRLSPVQMNVVSRFFAIDGTCTLANRATWSFAGAPPPPTPPPTTCTVRPTSVAVNKRLGPGLSYTILGQLLPGTTSAVIGVSYDFQGRRWWQLADLTWVSSVVTIAQGNCPS